MPKKYFEFKNINNDAADLYLYGEITSFKWQDTDVSAMDFKNELDSIGNRALNIYINSPGGSVMEGMAICSMLKRHKGETNAYVDGMAASIASVIALSCDNVYIPKNAYLMIHNAWAGGIAGNSEELRAIADTLDKISEGIVEVYKSKSKVEEKIIKELMDTESWLTGNDVTDYFNINVIEEKKIAASIKDFGMLEKYKNSPKFIQVEEPKNTINNELEAIKIKLNL